MTTTNFVSYLNTFYWNPKYIRTSDKVDRERVNKDDWK